MKIAKDCRPKDYRLVSWLVTLITGIAFWGLLLWLFSAEAHAQNGFSIWVGAGKNNSMMNHQFAWEDNGQSGCAFGIDYTHQIKGKWYWDGSISHISQCNSGQPVDSKDESGVELYYIKLRYWL